MKSNISKSIFLLFIVAGIFLGSCKSKVETYDDQIPYVNVNFTIQTNSLMFGDLNMPGNWTYLNGGFKGIIVYHGFDNNYYAYERCCSFDPRITDARVWVNEESFMLYDSVCGSEFFLLDGTPTADGPAISPLRQFNTEYNPANYTLHIWN